MAIETDRADQQILEEEIEAFARGLASDGVAGEALHRETGRIRLFLLHYLLGFAGRGIADVEPGHLIDFVGTWLIRHVSNVTPDSIRSLLRTLSTYFHQRADRGQVSAEELEEIAEVLRSEPFFLSRLEDYHESVADEDAFDTWLDKRWGWVNISDHARTALFHPLAADHTLLVAIGEEEVPPLVDDFVNLLAGLRELPARLARSGRRLAAGTVEALNDRMDDPDPLPKRPRQSDAPRVNALFTAAVRLGLCGLESGGRVTASPSADAVESMGRRERLALVLDTVWNLSRGRTSPAGRAPGRSRASTRDGDGSPACWPRFRRTGPPSFVPPAAVPGAPPASSPLPWRTSPASSTASFRSSPGRGSGR